MFLVIYLFIKIIYYYYVYNLNNLLFKFNYLCFRFVKCLNELLIKINYLVFVVCLSYKWCLCWVLNVIGCKVKFYLEFKFWVLYMFYIGYL